MQGGFITPAALAPPSGPVITDHPDSGSVLVNSVVVLSVTATGPGTLTYQWFEDGNAIPGETGTSYTFTATETATYFCVVTNTGGQALSNTATITVFELPEDVLGPPPTYLGALRISQSGVENTQLTYGGIAGRDDGGTVKLYFTADYSSAWPIPTAFIESIVEVIDPGSGYDTNYLTAPIATTSFYTNGYRNGAGNKKYTWVPSEDDPQYFDSGTGAVTGGVYWHEGNQRLYIAYNDTYDTGGFQLHGLLSVQLVPNGDPPHGSTIGYGPWSIQTVDQDGRTHRGPRSCLYMSQHSITGEMMCGSAITGGNAASPWGPSHFTGAAFPTDATPVGKNEVVTLPDRGLWYYYMGFYPFLGGFQLTNAGTLIPGKDLRAFRRRLTPSPYDFMDATECGPADAAINVDPAVYSDAIGFTGSWRDLDGLSGGLYIQIGTKAVYLYCATLCNGHNWYMNACKPVCNHGVSPLIPATGPVTSAAFPGFIGIDPADVEAAINGDIEDWEVEASYEVNMETAYPGIRTCEPPNSPIKAMWMGYFHASTRRLFLHAPRADNSRFGVQGSLIHVFQWPENP